MLKWVPQSTTEAENVATVEATKEAIWLDIFIMKMVSLHCDSQSALQCEPDHG